jgi:hypothetical protein
MITELSQKFGCTLPDNVISELDNPGKIISMFQTQKQSVASFKGVPALELLCGQELPPNLQIVNYRKKKWSNQVFSQFVAKAFAKADSNNAK